LASTAFCIWTTGSCCIVWTTAIGTILAATTCRKTSLLICTMTDS
jgi:hypothetical protein